MLFFIGLQNLQLAVLKSEKTPYFGLILFANHIMTMQNNTTASPRKAKIRADVIHYKGIPCWWDGQKRGPLVDIQFINLPGRVTCMDCYRHLASRP